jgi:hypothetical protein
VCRVQESDAEEQQQQQHYCIVCEKRFRSAGQLANHERSRAHRDALAALMEVLQEEEAWLLVRVCEIGFGFCCREVTVFYGLLGCEQGTQGGSGSTNGSAARRRSVAAGACLVLS